MDINYDVPFYSNTEDDTHCFQAALKMVLKYFLPKKSFDWEELEKATAKEEGLWTWPLAGMIWMKAQRFDVKSIEVFDYERFITEREKYLIEFYGLEGGSAQIKNSNIEQEIDFAKKLLEKGVIEKGIPTATTLRKLLKDGYLLICLVNSSKLNKQDGYVGHFVVIKGITDDKIILHDPGLPPLENREVSFEAFEKAWASPDEHAKNVMAFKR